LIREVYLSFHSLVQRLNAFRKYRKLMASMNRFQNPTAEELEEEHTCIICRDEMMVETAKRLPGCGHMYVLLIFKLLNSISFLGF
jgi:E3 ubiquitin-protein ligase synoviolin